MKKILITGAGSYIGTSFENYLKKWPEKYSVDTVDMIDGTWRGKDFSEYDTVFHVAGIAHSDSGKISAEKEKLYYSVNTDLTIETAKKAKEDGVKQFIFMSSAIVYGDSAPIGKMKMITKDTPVKPANCYGDSKVQAENGIKKLEDEKFKVVILRPPMIYGKDSKGNYPVMAKFAQKLPIFPSVKNCRSMLYIGNLTEFIRLMIDNEETGTFWPQNPQYSNTSTLVKGIARAHGKNVVLLKGFTWVLKFMSHFTGVVNKAFGNLAYDKSMSVYKENYQIYSLERSIKLTECSDAIATAVKTVPDKKLVTLEGKKILLIALPGYSDGIVNEMKKLGAEVDYINDKPSNGFICKTLGRLQVGFYQKRIHKYYCEQIEKLKNKDYDYILSIRGEYTPTASLKKMRSVFYNAKIILYMWDGMNKANTKGIEKKWSFYDKVYTFDRIDYEAHKDRMSFLPLYYYNEYLPKECKEPNSNDFKYDISFIGTGHDDRIKIVKSVLDDCKRNKKKSFSYFFIPHKLVFYKYKLLNKNDFTGVKISDVKFKMLPFEKLYKIYADSKCVIDIENSGQHGLTMRTIEILGLKRKLITTNKDIVNYDFYNENNILLIDRNNPKVDMDFFERPYVTLSEEIYEKYSLKNWIIEVLR
ncbi:NAD-dependent epimerase/dehydratase family protein [uncultured Ruminococcus sp.]|uniref:NAD-dependent epimerase/dehydratase family protein n=1 Tax=uncultured Ruminococcus sp. TaxID=165186 RepID=UPI003441EEAD